MIEAREGFLRAGHTAGLRETIAATAAELLESSRTALIVDAGAGTGYYLARILDLSPHWKGIALDASKYALRRAARAHVRVGAVGCDIWSRLPLKDQCAALVLNVFSPRNGEEFRRVLVAGGHVLVVTPTADHLQELVAPLGLITVDPSKQQRLHAGLSPWLERISSETYRSTLTLKASEVEILVGMGPSARHLHLAELRTRIDQLVGKASVPVTFSVDLSVFQAS
jgi:23S rRNA (guanine745-N1)-methyltransferase